MTTGKELAERPLDKLKLALSAESVQQQFQNALQENRGSFIASIIDLVASTPALQQCSPNAIIMECLKAATLKLPINRQLGFAWIVPYKVKGVPTPQFQIGYKGYVQLAMRTGQYRYLNADAIYEGQKVEDNKLTGEIKINGNPVSSKAIGYFAYLELLNGFSKAVYMSREQIIEHAKRFSKSWDSENSIWMSDFDAMSIKTAIRRLLSKYGYMSVEMATGISHDEDYDEEAAFESEVETFADREVIDMPGETNPPIEDAKGSGPDF